MRLYEFAVNDDDAGKWYSDEEMVSIVGKHWKTDEDIVLDSVQIVADAQDWLEKNGYTVEVVDVKRYKNTFYWYIKGTIYKNLRENKMRYKEYCSTKKQRVAEGLSDIVKGIKRKVAGKTDPKEVEHTYARIARRDIEDANKLNNQAAYDARDKSTKRWEKVNKVVNKEGVAEGLGTTPKITFAQQKPGSWTRIDILVNGEVKFQAVKTVGPGHWTIHNKEGENIGDGSNKTELKASVLDYLSRQGVAEGSYKEGGSITHDGVEYDFDKVLAMAETKPTKQCSVSKLAWVLAYDEPDTTRLKNADISVPVVITKSNNGKLTVIDGLHRLAKAVDSNIKSLPVKYITSGELQSARLKQGVAEDSNKSNSTDNQNSFSNKLQNKLNIDLGKIGDLPVSTGIQKAQGKSFNVGSATGSGHRPSVSIGDPQKGTFAQLTNKGVMLGYKKTFESNKKIKENTGQEPGMFEFYDVNTLKRVFHPFEARDIQDALIKADDFLEAIGKSGKGLSVRPVRDSSSDLAEFSTQNNVKHKNVLKEGPSITSTLRAIINDIGEPVLQVYSTMKSAANKFVENKGELKGFNLIAGGIGNRWFQTFWFNKLQKELHHLVQQSPRHTEKLKEFLRTSPGSFSTIADQLPEILETIGKQLNNRELYSNANKWISTRNNFKGYLVGLESSVAQDDEQEPVSTEKSIKKTLGQQANQAEQLVNAIINSLPNNVAGDIRNAIARSPNKLQALQTELQRRGIRPPVAEDAGVTTTANIASVPNPHISPGPARGKRSYIGSPGRSGTKSPPQPKPKKQKPTDNALNMRNTSIFGEPLRRK